jgi:hypothetical protein
MEAHKMERRADEEELALTEVLTIGRREAFTNSSNYLYVKILPRVLRTARVDAAILPMDFCLEETSLLTGTQETISPHEAEETRSPILHPIVAALL